MDPATQGARHDGDAADATTGDVPIPAPRGLLPVRPDETRRARGGSSGAWRAALSMCAGAAIVIVAAAALRGANGAGVGGSRAGRFIGERAPSTSPWAGSRATQAPADLGARATGTAGGFDGVRALVGAAPSPEEIARAAEADETPASYAPTSAAPARDRRHEERGQRRLRRGW